MGQSQENTHAPRIAYNESMATRQELREQKAKAEFEENLKEPPIKDIADRARSRMSIPLDIIYPDDNIRPDLPEVYRLAQSIRETGLLQPLLVRPNPDDDGSYFLVAGARRRAALEILGIEEVMCEIISDLKEEEIAEVQLTENVHRENLSPIQTAEALRYIMEMNPKSTAAKLARSLGLDPMFVQRHFRILKLPKTIQEKLDRGDMSFYIADMLRKGEKTGRLTREEAEQLAEDYVEGKIKSGEIRKRALPELIPDDLGPLAEFTEDPAASHNPQIIVEDASLVQDTLQPFDERKVEGTDIEDAVVIDDTPRRTTMPDIDPSKAIPNPAHNVPMDMNAKLQDMAGEEDQRHGAQQEWRDVPERDMNEMREMTDRYMLRRALQEWASDDYLKIKQIPKASIVAYTETLVGPQLIDEMRHLVLWLIQNP